MNVAQESETNVTGAHGLRIHLRVVGSEDADRTLVIVHGYGEHGGRYLRAARRFADAGWRVSIPDVRGHGRTGGPRGHVLDYDHFIVDLAAVLDEARTPPERTALFGHSHGGLIGATWLLQRPGTVAAAALSSPLFGIAVEAPAWKIVAGNWISRVLPKVSLPTEIDPQFVSHDPEVVADYQADPLNHHVVNSRWFTEAVEAMDWAHDNAQALDVPTLVIQAGDDKLVSASESRRWAESADAAYEEVAGAYHELWFEPDGETHRQRVADFLDEHVAA